MKVLSIVGIVINAFLLLGLLGLAGEYHSRETFDDVVGVGVIAILFGLALSIVGTASQRKV